MLSGQTIGNGEWFIYDSIEVWSAPNSCQAESSYAGYIMWPGVR